MRMPQIRDPKTATATFSDGSVTSGKVTSVEGTSIYISDPAKGGRDGWVDTQRAKIEKQEGKTRLEKAKDVGSDNYYGKHSEKYTKDGYKIISESVINGEKFIIEDDSEDGWNAVRRNMRGWR
jgi:hypothetical protein